MSRKYAVNEHFFDTWTPDSAYIAGWIVGDGSITEGPHSKIYLMGSVGERDHLECMIRAMGSSHPVRIYECNRTSASQIGSKVLVQALIGKGLSKKAGLHLPKSFDGSEKHFIRGLFDSDGFVGYCTSNRSGGHQRQLVMSFSQALPIAVEFIAHWVRPFLGERKVWESGGKYSIGFRANSAWKLFQELKPSEKDLYLARKWVATAPTLHTVAYPNR